MNRTKQTAAAIIVTCICLLLLGSCSSSIPLKEGQTIRVQFYSQGAKITETVFEHKDRFTLPEPPVRDGYTFNGWWVTTEHEGVVEFTRDWLSEHLEEGTVKVNARWLETSYTFEQQELTTVGVIQDGTIWGDWFFKFHSTGLCYVYSRATGKKVGGFTLNRADEFKPHCNAVCFGNRYFAEGDEFPLLYANIYNNYNKDEFDDKRAGMVCVYRIQRNGTQFSTTLVQVIRVSFADDQPWRSKWDSESQTWTDRSPWGNFIVDTDNSKLWVFVTRDANRTTRFFCFDLPEVQSDSLGMTLTEADVIRTFDIPYSWYLQGACYHQGKIYSTEGLGTDANPSRIRVVDLEHGIEDCVIDLYADYAYMREAEYIDFADGVFWYGDYKKINNNPTAFLYRMTGI